MAAVNANESLRNSKIAARVAELRAQHTAAAILTRDHKRAILKLIAENLSLPPDVRIRAMREDSKMAGHYEPEKHVVDAGSNTLARARERAAMIAFPLSRLNKAAPTVAER